MTAAHERLPIEQVTDLIKVGEPLPFRVLDSLERLLLNEGQVIANDRQMEMLIERGAWVDRTLVEERRREGAGKTGGKVLVTRVVTLFDRWERLVWELDAVLRRTLKGGGTCADEWQRLVDEVTGLVDRDPDIALFAAVRQEDRRFALYPLSHAVHAGVVALLAARQAGWDAERQHSLLGASLSMNVAMLELQALMAEQDTPPTNRQLETILAHTVNGVNLLQAAGITDTVWLRAVAEHHEHADGSGYPRGLVEVSEEARVLRMADVYMAKITPRAKRPPLPPMMASRQLFQQEPGSALAMSVIRAIGVHPPGALVQLKSGEVAVVKRCGSGPAPKVFTLSDARGKPSARSAELDSAQAEHGISGPCADPAAFSRIPGERVYGIVLA